MLGCLYNESVRPKRFLVPHIGTHVHCLPFEQRDPENKLFTQDLRWGIASDHRPLLRRFTRTFSTTKGARSFQRNNGQCPSCSPWPQMTVGGRESEVPCPLPLKKTRIDHFSHRIAPHPPMPSLTIIQNKNTSPDRAKPR